MERLKENVGKIAIGTIAVSASAFVIYKIWNKNKPK